MAKQPARRPAGKAPPPPPSGINPAHKTLLIVVGLALVPFSLPTLVLLFFAMFPTMVAAFVDRGPHRYLWLAVGGLNFAGVAPYMLGMWFGRHSLEAAFDILTDPGPLLVIYGASAAGWMLYMATPSVAGFFVDGAAQRRVEVLRAKQRQLIEDWGNDVSMLD